MKFKLSIFVLAVTVGVICNGLPYLRKSKTSLKKQSKWEDFFIEDPNLSDKDFNLEEILRKPKVFSSGWSDCGKPP